jgi:hypothetical protein
MCVCVCVLYLNSIVVYIRRIIFHILNPPPSLSSMTSDHLRDLIGMKSSPLGGKKEKQKQSIRKKCHRCMQYGPVPKKTQKGLRPKLKEEHTLIYKKENKKKENQGQNNIATVYWCIIVSVLVLSNNCIVSSSSSMPKKDSHSQSVCVSPRRAQRRGHGQRVVQTQNIMQQLKFCIYITTFIGISVMVLYSNHRVDAASIKAVRANDPAGEVFVLPQSPIPQLNPATAHNIMLNPFANSVSLDFKKTENAVFKSISTQQDATPRIPSAATSPSQLAATSAQGLTPPGQV